MLKMTPFDANPARAIATGPYQGTMTLASAQQTLKTTADGRGDGKTSSLLTGPKNLLNAVKPSSISKNITGFLQNASEMVGDVMPQAQQTVKSRQQKAARGEADAYEAKRRREIDEQRVQYSQGKGGRKRF